MEPLQVIGVGDADVDLYLGIDELPARDQKVSARSVAFHPGGMVANFLVALRRLGTTCGFHGPVGDDEYGHIARNNFISNGVDVEGMVMKPGERTYFCVIMLDASGEKRLILAPTGCLAPEPEDISAEVIARAQHMHTTATNMAAKAKAIALAQEHDLTISVDAEGDLLSSAAPLWPYLGQIDVLFVKQDALKSGADGASLRDAADHILAQGTGVVCVTMGAAGAWIASRAESFAVDAFAVEVVDSTGAGDAFAAGFVHGFVNGWPLRRSATLATAAAARTIMRVGGHAGAPTLAEATALIRSEQRTTQGVEPGE